MKRCTRCGEIKPLDGFHIHRRNRDGRYSWCKACKALAAALYNKIYPEKANARLRHWRKTNVEKARASQRRSTLKSRSTVVGRLKHSADACRWYAENKEQAKTGIAKWQAENPEKVREYHKRSGIKYRNIPGCKLNSNIRKEISCSLNGSKAGRHWEDLVGFTVENLKKHLEKRFKPGMTWENYGSYWHIDHKIPIAVFNFEKPEDLDFTKCWSLTNLQPLKAKDNLSKGAKIDHPFQPSLAIHGGIING